MVDRSAHRQVTVGARANPWITTPTPSNPMISDLTLPDGDDHQSLSHLPATGPLAPHPGVPAPSPEHCLPQQLSSAAATSWWLGAHGGAGESTLAGLLPGSRAAGHAWPQPLPEQDAVVVLVARTSLSGLQHAQSAAAQWASGAAPGVDLLGLVLIADAPGRLPTPLRDFAGVVAGGVPRTWHLPWIEALRLSTDPAALAPPRPLRRLMSDVASLLPVPQTVPAVPHGEEAPRAHHAAHR